MHYASFVGIDVAANKLDVCVHAGAVPAQVVTLPYTDAALSRFLATHAFLVPSECLIGLESTGDYHRQAARFFLERGFPVNLLNPILTKQYTRTTIRGTKTDKTDAELITRLLADGQGYPLTLANLQNEPKELLRIATNLTKVSSALQLQLQSVKRKDIARTDRLMRRFSEIIEEIRDLSEETVAQATKERSDEERFIDSIPGFAVKLSGIVRHEIGDVSRFANTKSLVAFAGLDPKIKQSGAQLDTAGKLTKRGSPYLRYALCLAANVAYQHDPELNAYYAKKKSEGRSHTEILCMVARKLLARIHAVLKERRCYVKRTI